MRGTLWLAVQAASVNISSLLVFIVLGRLLVPEQFGLAAAASIVVLLLRMLVDAGISGALIRRLTIDSELIDTAFWLSLGVGVVLTALNLAVAPLVADLFGQPGLTTVVRALSPVILLAALDRTQSSLLDRELNFRAQALRSLAAAIVSSAAAIALAVSGAGVYSLVAQTVVFEAVSAVLLWHLSKWRPRRRFRRDHLAELLGFGGRNSGIQVLGYVSSNIDNLLVGAFLGPASLGIYVVGYRVLVVFDELLSMTLRRVALPAFSRLQSDPAAMNTALTRVAGLSAVVILPAAAGLACIAPNLVPFVFGEQWTKSVAVMQALSGTAVVLAAVTPLRNYVIASGRVANELRWTIGITVAEAVGFVVAAQYNVVAVAATLTAISLIYWPLRVLSLRRLTKLRPAAYWWPWLRPTLATIVMVCVVVGVGRLMTGVSHGVALVVQIVSGAISYLLALSQIDRPKLRDLVGMLRLARSRSGSGPGVS